MTYAAYRAPGPGATFAPLARGLRIAYLVGAVLGTFGVLGLVVSLTMLFSTRPHHAPSHAAIVLTLSSYSVLVVTLIGMAALGVAWMYRAWSWLPVDQRYTRNWRSWITPAQAAFFLLVPYFQYYWMFVVNLGLCDALDRLRVMYPTREPAPKNLAMAACILQILFWPLAFFFFYAFMRKVERMTEEMSAGASARRGAAF
jgi:hypothetical protein